MSQSLTKILLHVVFSTKNRQPIITQEIESRLHQYLSAICNNHDCPVIQIGGMPDHIHILLFLSRKITISDLLAKIKSNSSKWIKTIDPKFSTFQWQNGYGAFSLSESARENAIKYIANQKEHHKKMSFQDEFLKLLEKYKVNFDAKYLWE